jgi:hypothetical protein
MPCVPRRVADTPVKPEELARAKNQLRSSLLMNLEMRSILCEDIGRQVSCVAFTHSHTHTQTHEHTPASPPLYVVFTRGCGCHRVRSC